jgi:hypothetical protein
MKPGTPIAVAPIGPAAPPSPAFAALRIAPSGSLAKIPRDYLIALELPFAAKGALAGADTELGDLARRLLGGLSSDDSAADRMTVREVSHAGKFGKDGAPTTVVTAFEAESLCTGRPSGETIDRMRAALAEAGYRVTVQERRVCVEAGCMADALVEWSAVEQRPQGWYNEQTCSRHNYRNCVGCGSVYRLMSEAASGPAPSLHCSVCGAIMIEWGGSKLWEAELITTSPAH